jgi:hypothetical protein
MSNNSNTLARRDTRAVATRQRIEQDVTVLDSLPKTPIAKIEDLGKTFLALKEHVNLVCPLASVDTILPMHQVSLRAVYINPEVNKKGVGPECYRGGGWCDEDEVALGKVALDKLEAAAGVKRIGGGRSDDRSEPYFCEFNVILEITDFDGTTRSAVGTKALDLRDGMPETLKAEWVSGNRTGRMVAMDPSTLAAKRTHMLALCETKARLRALRELLGLQQKYTLEDLARPFVIPKLVPHLDVNDPETKTALIDHALGNTRSLYGKASPIIDAPQLPAEVMPPSKRVEGERIDDDSETQDNQRPAQAQPESTIQADADELAGFGDPPPPEPEQIVVCGCTCAHQAQISQKVYDWTKERLGGSARCEKCYPWNANGTISTRFDFSLHELDQDLGIQTHKGLTPRKLQQSQKAQR